MSTDHSSVPDSIRVLIVDDDPKFRDLTASGLAESGLVPETADGITAAREALARSRFDVVLLDRMMQGEDDGSVLLEELRARREDVPVLFVTARGEANDRVGGLRMGADDYVVKPFTFAELIARIEAVVRRHRGAIRFASGRFVLDPQRSAATFDGQSVPLSATEFGLLGALLRRHGAAVERATLLREVWQTNHDPGTNVIDVVVGRVRKKLRAVGAPTIETVRGVGYRLEEEA